MSSSSRSGRTHVWIVLVAACATALALLWPRALGRDTARVERSSASAPTAGVLATLESQEPRSVSDAASAGPEPTSRVVVPAGPGPAALLVAVLIDDARIVEHFALELVRTDSTTGENVPARTALPPARRTIESDTVRYEWAGLAAGRYDAEMSVGSAFGPLERETLQALQSDLLDLDLEAGARRVVEIDMRAIVRRIDLTVLDSNGGVLGEAEVWYPNGFACVDAHGRASIWASNLDTPITALCESCLGEQRVVPLGQREFEFRLAPAPRFRLRVDAPVLAVDEAIEWYCRRLPDRDTLFPIASSVTDGGEPWRPPCEGRLEVRAELTRDGRVHIKSDPVFELDVVAGMEDRELMLRVSTTELADARERLAAQLERRAKR